jgi:hypothetical protein
MVDFWTLSYGALATILSLALLKIIDMLLEKFYSITVFGNAWLWLSIKFKQLFTRLKPIRIRFEFSTAIESTKTEKVKSSLDFLSTAISKKQQISISPLAWSDDNSVGTSNIQYHDKDFFLKVSTSQLATSPILIEQEEAFLNSDLMSTEDIAFDLESRFAFYELEEMLLNLGTLLNLIKEELKESLLVSHFSNGIFTLETTKGKINIDKAIKEKDFEVSLVLKSKDKFTIKLYPTETQVMFPSLQIDDKVLEYLRFVILHYYF